MESVFRADDDGLAFFVSPPFFSETFALTFSQCLGLRP